MCDNLVVKCSCGAELTTDGEKSQGTCYPCQHNKDDDWGWGSLARADTVDGRPEKSEEE
jgi:hypothetical protein